MERPDPIALSTEFTGTVFCPPRQGPIAVMRCWEYQTALGCGFGCKNAVKKELVEAVKALARQDEEVGRGDRPVARFIGRKSEICACGRRKSPQSEKCSHCCWRDSKADDYCDVCQQCGAKKAHNKKRHCQSCGQKARVGRRRKGGSRTGTARRAPTRRLGV